MAAAYGRSHSQESVDFVTWHSVCIHQLNQVNSLLHVISSSSLYLFVTVQ